MTTPEARARGHIDALLAAAGWVLQDRDQLNLGAPLSGGQAGRGVAVRESPLYGRDASCPYYADCLLFVDRQAVGAVEAKKAGITLAGVEAQSAKYGDGLSNTLLAPKLSDRPSANSIAPLYDLEDYRCDLPSLSRHDQGQDRQDARGALQAGG